MARNKHIRKILIDKYQMNVYTMSGRTKGSIVERFNRTLKSRLERYFTESKDHRWIDVLQQMTKNINNTVNRSTGFKPNEVTRNNSDEIKARLYSAPDIRKPCTLKIGDRVRIIKEKNFLEKGYSQSKIFKILTYVIYLNSDWSNTIYEITHVEQSLGVCYYRVKNNEGEILSRSFYKEELNLVLPK